MIEDDSADHALREKRARLVGLWEEDAGVHNALPLSFAQRRLWFLTQLERENPAYNIPQALRVIGDLDREALKKPSTAIVRRHEVLRATFRLVKGEPVQVLSTGKPTVVFVNLESLPVEQREAEGLRLRTVEARRPFDLSQNLPLRATLIRLAPDDHLLLLTIHHIVSDGWSMGVLTRELSAIYKALASGHEIDLPELPIQYADYAEWQREWLQGEVLAEQLSYWQEAPAGAPPVLELPTNPPPPPSPTLRGPPPKLPPSK